MQLHLGIKAFTKPNGVTSGELLKWMHYGTELIPPRPVLRNAAEKVVKDFGQAGAAKKSRFETYFDNLLKNPRDAKKLETVLFQDLGRQCVAEAKAEIDASEGLQHNAPSTAAKKGFDKPLFETGEFKNALAYEVVE